MTEEKKTTETPEAAENLAESLAEEPASQGEAADAAAGA